MNYLLPAEAFGLMMGLATAGLIINWATISIVHLRFRAAKAGTRTGFPSPLYPLANYLCLAFLAGITVVMYLIPGMRISVYLIPVWLLLLCIGYAVRQRRARAALA